MAQHSRPELHCLGNLCGMGLVDTWRRGHKWRGLTAESVAARGRFALRPHTGGMDVRGCGAGSHSIQAAACIMQGQRGSSSSAAIAHNRTDGLHRRACGSSLAPGIYSHVACMGCWCSSCRNVCEEKHFRVGGSASAGFSAGATSRCSTSWSTNTRHSSDRDSYRHSPNWFYFRSSYISRHASRNCCRGHWCRWSVSRQAGA
mmetsp:Transcript_33762/g.78031  ORF Transcript_33762/g.78031 Transcript_33762/m.78031 type:complete len:202 (-) Transcript_33762:205-810(-)